MHRQTALGALASYDRSIATMSKTNIMNPSSNIYVNTELDLALGRVVDVSRELVWKAWTDPKHLVKSFVLRPWTTTTCEIDPRP